MNCPKCNRPNDDANEYCACGYNFPNPDSSTITANEFYIFRQTRTSHKRYESMVMYALHYALRDVQLLSQYPVECEGQRFLLDGYFPALNLALEIDEPHHEHQYESDKERQALVSKTLGCDFIRISCKESLYQQVDKIVDRIRQENLEPWCYERPQPNRRSGDYSAQKWAGLVENEIPEMMDSFMDSLSQKGYCVEHGSKEGIPSRSNGEYGFLLHHTGFTLAIYARKSKKINIRCLLLPDGIKPNDLGDILKPRQNKNRPPRFYELKAQPRGAPTTARVEEVLQWFVRAISEKSQGLS